MTGPEALPSAEANAGSVSVVIVVEETAPDAAALTSWGEALAALFNDTEFVLIANGVPSAVALALEALTANLPDITVHFLAERIDHDTAYLVGLDTAVGDWVLLTELHSDRLRALRDVIGRLAEGYQVAIAVGDESREHSPIYSVLARLYFRLYRLSTGRAVLVPPAALRLYARAVALYIAGSSEGEMLIKAGTIAGGFPAVILRYPGLTADPPRWRGLRGSIAKGVHELLSASALPLRMASLVALATGVLSLLYSLYVVGVYMLKPDVLQGWTTLSLQISGMMFLFSLLFALMAEYVLGIYRGISPRRRYVIVRELRSRSQRQPDRLNVVDGSGVFRLGMPVENTP